MRNWEMYTEDGDVAVDAHVRELRAAMRANSFPRSELQQRVDACFKAIASGYPEVYDTEPRNNIAEEVDKVCREIGWLPLGEIW